MTEIGVDTRQGGGDEIPTLHSLEVGLDLAYADLARFMAGWGWWCGAYIEERAKRVLDRLDGIPEGEKWTEEEHGSGYYESVMLRAFPLELPNSD